MRSTATAGRSLYANLTQALIGKCNLLLALWDGQHVAASRAARPIRCCAISVRALSRAAMSPAIEFQRGGSRGGMGTAFRLLDPDAARRRCGRLPQRTQLPVRHRREPAGRCTARRCLTPLAQQFAELNTYNREFERLNGKHAFERLDSLLPTLGPIDARADREALQRIDAEYGKADALAIYYQRHSDRLFRGSATRRPCMALLFLVYAKLWANSLLLSVYLTLLLLSVVVFHRLRTHQWFSKHLVYRVLAETMRIKFFLRAAGADRLVSADGADQSHRHRPVLRLQLDRQSAEERRAARRARRERRRATDRARLESVHRHWIVGQQEYFRRRVRTLERDHRRLEVMKSCDAVRDRGVRADPAGVRRPAALSACSLRSPAKDGVMFLMGLLPVWLGIWELYQNKMAMRELLWQYRNQLGHFTIAELQLSRSAAASRHQEILAQVGKEALMESYLWTIHRYHREYEPPTAT